MVLRLIIGLVKGLVVGGLLGFALAKAGFAAPGPIIAYLAAALSGALVGLIAGKPIWAEGARIEAGMKAFAGAVLGLGLLWVVRRWLTIPLPVSLGAFSAPNEALGETAANGTLGGLAVSSYAIVAAVLGGFFEADNTPDGESKSGGAKAAQQEPAAAAGQSKKRVASSSSTGDPELDALLADDEAPPAEKKGRR